MILADFLLVSNGGQERQIAFETHEIYQNVNALL